MYVNLNKEPQKANCIFLSELAFEHLQREILWICIKEKMDKMNVPLPYHTHKSIKEWIRTWSKEL